MGQNSKRQTLLRRSSSYGGQAKAKEKPKPQEVSKNVYFLKLYAGNFFDV
jgi:hypothetical protein